MVVKIQNLPCTEINIFSTLEGPGSIQCWGYLTRLGVISQVRFLVSLKVKEGDNQVHKSEVEQVIYFSKYSVVLADVDNE